MGLPEFDPETGFLPDGIHEATLQEVAAAFGWNKRRRQLLDGLESAIDLLRATGCRRVWLNGSFVTDKEVPNDFDAAWDPTGVDRELLDPIFLDLAHPRQRQKEAFGGELVPNVIESNSGSRFSEFFRRDRSGEPKGIVVIQLKGEAR